MAIVQKWRRFVIRKLHALAWHCHAVLLWLVHRPQLRGFSIPFPCVENVYQFQLSRKKEISAPLLAMLVECRTKMGYKLAFLCQPEILKGIMKAGTVTRLKQAATKAVAAPAWSATGLPLGPRGGLPRSKPALVELARALQIVGAEGMTVEKLQQACRETLEFMKTNSASAPPAAAPTPKQPPPHIPWCKDCHAQMVERVNRTTQVPFWGRSNYPKCTFAWNPKQRVYWLPEDTQRIPCDTPYKAYTPVPKHSPEPSTPVMTQEMMNRLMELLQGQQETSTRSSSSTGPPPKAYQPQGPPPSQAQNQQIPEWFDLEASGRINEMEADELMGLFQDTEEDLL
jgi:ssDNA-binding Zn-finger/Zn-ribbon topoisomerase 1